LFWGFVLKVLVEVIEFKSVVGVRYSIEGGVEVSAFLLSWLFSCEVQVIEDRLLQPSVVSAFNGVWEEVVT
jgi:hypothetical protein